MQIAVLSESQQVLVTMVLRLQKICEFGHSLPYFPPSLTYQQMGMFIPTAIALAATFAPPAWAKQNMAQCTPDFKWVRSPANFFFKLAHNC